MMNENVWIYRETLSRDVADSQKLVGYSVEATDGDIGKIDEASTETSRSYLVVDTGFWIFGKKRMLPAGVVDRIDVDDRRIFVNRTKDQIKDAPDWDDARAADVDYRVSHSDYYGRF